MPDAGETCWPRRTALLQVVVAAAWAGAALRQTGRRALIARAGLRAGSASITDTQVDTHAKMVETTAADRSGRLSQLGLHQAMQVLQCRAPFYARGGLLTTGNNRRRRITACACYPGLRDHRFECAPDTPRRRGGPCPVSHAPALHAPARRLYAVPLPAAKRDFDQSHAVAARPRHRRVFAGPDACFPIRAH